MNQKYFVTAIGTDSGKTLVSAILTDALQADYWKPIQSGYPRDTDTVQSLVGSTYSLFYKEAYLFQKPASPHDASNAEGITIDLNHILLPGEGDNPLVIEGAGGVLVPLNDKDYVIDLALKFEAEVILVSNLYLGSINHTLLTIEALKSRNVKVKGIVFNGDSNPESERIILEKSGYKCLLRIKKEKVITQDIVHQYAVKLFENWYD